MSIQNNTPILELIQIYISKATNPTTHWWLFSVPGWVSLRPWVTPLWPLPEAWCKTVPCATWVLQGFSCICTSALQVTRPALSLQHGVWGVSSELLPSAAKPAVLFSSHASGKEKLIGWAYSQDLFLLCWDRSWNFSVLTTGEWVLWLADK